MPQLNIKEVKDFRWGQIDTLEDRSLPRGACSKGLNWLTLTDRIELRRGQNILGNETTGAGKVHNTVKVTKRDGTNMLWRKRGQKLEYMNDSDVWTEVGSNVFGSAAEDDKATFQPYHSLAGYQLWINCPNGPFIKIMIYNPDDYADMHDSSKNYKGYIKIKQNRIFLWGRKASLTTVYVSHIDDVVDSKTDVSAENVGTGDGAETDFSDTLEFKAAGAKRTCFAIEVTDGVETFTDNGDGTLTGDQGGTGTINYMTGAITVSFDSAPADSQAITCDYSWEDSTSDGIADFTFTSPTRVAGEGCFFPQNDGGEIMDIYSIGDSEYCMHRSKTWVLTLTDDDTAATNLIYREKVGIPAVGAGVSTGDGIYYIDTSDEKDFQIRLLTLDAEGNVIPKSISKQLLYEKKRVGIDLSSYLFDKATMFEWGDYILCACRTSDSSENNRVILYHKSQRTIDILDYLVSEFAEYDGTLIGGDSIGMNVFTLFSGHDDDESLIPNYWEGNNDDLGWIGLKKVKKKIIQGLIGPEQEIKVSAAIDNGAYVEVGRIRGDGSYVDKGQSVSVGALTVGKKEVGGGGASVIAYNYERELSFSQGKFDRVKIKFEALGLGHASVSTHLYHDIRIKSQKRPTKYRS